MNDQMKAPPLGLVPRFIRDEQRVAEILTAMSNYANAHISFPEEWLAELGGINKRLARHRAAIAKAAQKAAAEEMMLQSILRP